MVKRMLSILVAVVCLAVVVTPGFAALQAVGPVSGPGGFPLYYTDSNNLRLELCLDEGWCFFDPVDPTDPNQVALGIGGEVFWWMADAVTPVTGLPTGRASLTLGMEGTFGGAEAVTNGNQISFGRVRVRVDVPAPGTYTVTHPFGTLVFENVTVADGINYTADVGAANFLNVELGFAGALQSGIGPFLTWPNYQNEPSLQVRGPADPVTGAPGPLLAQYVGTLDIPHQVVGSPIPNVGHPSGFQNFFRVTGPTGVVIAETDLFGVMGKVYGGQAPVAHTFPAPPTPNLAEVGPINRPTDFGANGTAASLEPLFAAGAFVTDGSTAGFPFGYPTWYQDASGLRLTHCPAGNPMCIGDPIDPADPVQRFFGTGGESFWWSADAAIEEAGVDALLVLGMEGTFGGSEAMVDGGQISFGRTRIRVDTPVPGTYTVIYPYGQKTFTNVPAGRGAINVTGDVGINNPADPDFAFVGALFSEIGPNFLTWPDFANRTPAFLLANPEYANLQQRLDPLNPASPLVQYVGDLAVPHRVTGGSHVYEGQAVNYFRVIGPNGIDVRTDLFTITGKVYDPATFRVIPSATVPVAQADTATTIGTTPAFIDVLGNDSLNGAPIAPANATLALASPAGNGTAVLNANKTFTYTANPGFVGSDSFTYTVSVGGQVSLAATVTVTVQPAEVVGVARAQLDLRRLRWDIRGTGNATAEGRTMTVRMGSGTGPVIGTALVSAGRWTLRAGLNTAPPAGTVQIFVISDSGSPVFGPFNVTIR
jgi:hypothetical protein